MLIAAFDPYKVCFGSVPRLPKIATFAGVPKRLRRRRSWFLWIPPIPDRKTDVTGVESLAISSLTMASIRMPVVALVAPK